MKYNIELKDFIKKLEDYSASDIVTYLIENKYSFEYFSDEVKKHGGWDSAMKRKSVKDQMTNKDDEEFNSAVFANTIMAFEQYCSLFPNGLHVAEAKKKIRELEKPPVIPPPGSNDEWNDLDIDDISEIDDNKLKELLTLRGYDQRGVTIEKVRKYIEPKLTISDVPKNEWDVPEGYTDVFFWGIPSSGKTCALSAILSTIKKEYMMEAPECRIKFGATYRDTLINIFRKDIGYLPGRTNTDTTQYMPFLFYRSPKDKKRKISFFELSGEVFKYFYEKANGKGIEDIDGYDREEVEKAFNTLDILLKSNNQKIHFFFIDYNQESKYAGHNGQLTQANYLEAASTYFRDATDVNGKRVNIFQRKTDAVYVVVTKSDEMKDEMKDDDENDGAKKFLKENFGTFMGVLQRQCEDNNVLFTVKRFSIGDVIFKKICIINRDYSRDIIEELLDRVKPINTSWIGKTLRS